MSYPKSSQTDSSATVRYTVEIALDTLVDPVAAQPRDQVMDFLLAVDSGLGDYHFTEALRDKLSEALAEESDEEAGSTRQFLRWLVAMDDPQDEQGCKDRQAVTLTAIISRARNLLGGA